MTTNPTLLNADGMQYARTRQAEMQPHLPANKTGNDEWYSDDLVDDPKEPPITTGYRILVRPYPRREMVGNILVPVSNLETQVYQNAIGRIIGVGPIAWHDKGDGEPWAHVGDWVMFGKFAGTRFTYEGVRLTVMNDDDVLLVLPNPDLFQGTV